MSEAEEILEAKLQHSDYIGVENLILPWGRAEKSASQDLGRLELLVDVYFDRHFSTSSIFTEINHENLVQLIKTSVQEGKSLKFESLAEKIAWDLSQIPSSVAFFLQLVWQDVEKTQAAWRISLWRVSQATVIKNSELAELVVTNPMLVEKESIEMEKPIIPKVRSFPGNRQQAEEKALSEIPETPVKAVLALGGNLGDVAQTFRSVIDDLRKQTGIGISEISPLVRTKAVLLEGQEPQPDYLNAVLIIRCGLSARQLLALTQEIELKYGRERKEKWGARTLDIDIITYGNLYSSIPYLQLPHPRAHQRAFVLLPWSMVEETAVLPGQGEAVVLMNYAADINGILNIDTEWFTETAITHSDIAQAPLPAWNNLSDATQDIRIVDLYDDSEELAANPLAQLAGSDTELEEQENTREQHNPLAELEDFDWGDSVESVTAEALELDEAPVEYDEVVDSDESLIYPSKPGFWGRLKHIFTGEPTDEVNGNIESESPEDFFALIEKDLAVKEQELLKGRSFKDVVAEIKPPEVQESKNNDLLPPDTGEIPIQKIIEAADKAQQHSLERQHILRPSSAGPIPVDGEKEFPYSGE